MVQGLRAGPKGSGLRPELDQIQFFFFGSVRNFSIFFRRTVIAGTEENNVIVDESNTSAPDLSRLSGPSPCGFLSGNTWIFIRHVPEVLEHVLRNEARSNFSRPFSCDKLLPVRIPLGRQCRRRQCHP